MGGYICKHGTESGEGGHACYQCDVEAGLVEEEP